MIRGLVVALLMNLLALVAQTAAAQQFPSKPVHFVVPYPPGGAFDLMIRTLAEPLSERWGHPVIVDNRPGGSTIIGTEIVSRAAADGHTMLVTGPALVINPSLRSKLPYDAFKNFVPVTLVARSPLVLVVNAASATTSVRELLADARARPRQLSYASIGPGSIQHVIGETLNIEAKVDMVYAPFPGGLPALTALLGNHVGLVIANYSEVTQHLAAGTLRALAVASAERFERLPQVPTLIESGFKDMQWDVWIGIVAPAGTPTAAIARIQSDLSYALKLPSVRDKLALQGLSPVSSTPEAFGDEMRRQSASFATVVRAVGIKVD